MTVQQGAESLETLLYPRTNWLVSNLLHCEPQHLHCTLRMMGLPRYATRRSFSSSSRSLARCNLACWLLWRLACQEHLRLHCTLRLVALSEFKASCALLMLAARLPSIFLSLPFHPCCSVSAHHLATGLLDLQCVDLVLIKLLSPLPRQTSIRYIGALQHKLTACCG